MGHSDVGFRSRKYNLSASFPSKNAPTITPAMKADIVPWAINDLLDKLSGHLNFKSWTPPCFCSWGRRQDPILILCSRLRRLLYWKWGMHRSPCQMNHFMYNYVKFHRSRFKIHDKQDKGHKHDLALSKQAFSSSLSPLLLQEKGTAKLTSAY